MKGVFITNLLLLLLLNLLVKPFYILGIDRTVQNQVGAQAYGLYFAILNFTYLFQLIHDMGLQNYSHTTLSRHRDQIPELVPQILATKLILSLAYLVVVGLAATVMGYQRFFWPLLTLIALNQILYSFLAYVRAIFGAAGRYWVDSTLSVLDKALMIGSVGYLLWFVDGYSLTINHFVLFQTITLTASLLIGFVLLRRLNLLDLVAFRFDYAFSRRGMIKSAGFALVLALMTLYTRVDGVMLERLLKDGGQEAGIYAASFRLIDALNMFSLLFASLLLPMFSRLLADKTGLRRLLEAAAALLLPVALGCCVITVFWGDFLMQLLYVDATEYWSSVLVLLFFSYPAMVAIFLFSTLLTAAVQLKSMNLAFVFGVVLKICLSLWLIPQLGAWGAAMSTVVVQSILAIILIAIAWYQLGLSLSWRFFVIILSGSVLLFISAQQLQTWSSSTISKIALVVVCMIVFSGLLLTSGGRIFQSWQHREQQ